MQADKVALCQKLVRSDKTNSCGFRHLRAQHRIVGDDCPVKPRKPVGDSADGRAFGLVDDSAPYARAIAVYYRRDRGLAWLSL